MDQFFLFSLMSLMLRVEKNDHAEHICQLTIFGSVVVLFRKTNDALKEIRNEEPQYNWMLSNE